MLLGGETGMHAHSGRSPCRAKASFDQLSQVQLCARLQIRACPEDLFVPGMWICSFSPRGGRHAAVVSAGLKACPVHEKEARGRALTAVVSCMEKDMGKRSISSWLSYGSKELVLPCRGDLGTASPATYLPTYQSNSAHVLIGDYHVSQQALPSLFHLTYINRNAPLFSPRAATALLRGPAV